MIVVIEKCSKCKCNVIDLNISIGHIKYYEKFIVNNPIVCCKCGSENLDWWFGLLQKNNLTVREIKRY